MRLRAQKGVPSKTLSVFLALLFALQPLSLAYAESTSQRDLGRTSTNSGFRFTPNISDGSLEYSVPLTIPPGRNGIQPSLSLAYSSRPAPETNLFGHGWSISIPYIERRNYAGSDQLYDHKAFFSSLGGELASTTDSTVYKAKVEDGEFMQYTFGGNTWTVTDSKGTTYKFGHASSTQQYDPSDSQKVYKWMLQEVRDTNDNYISYSYTKDSNQLYPDVITYTGNGSTPGPFDVYFTKEARTDIATSTAEGFQVVTKFRISEIKAEVNDSWVRKYALAYTTGDNGTRSLLSSITESGSDGSTTLTLPATTFEYQQSTDSWSLASSWDIPEPFVEEDHSDSGTRLADVNGDGLPDIVRRNAGNTVNKVYLNNGSGWTLNSSWTVPIPLTGGDVVHPGGELVDVNGDGRIDIVRYLDQATSTNAVYINNGSAWVLSSSTLPTPLSSGSYEDTGTRFIDINADGLPDMAHYDQSDGPAGNQNYINNTAGWTYDSGWLLPEPIYSGEVDEGTRLADVNGDGLADVIRKDEAINKVYFNNGVEGWATSTWTVPGDGFMYNGIDQGTRLADINADGLLDLITSTSTNDNTGVYLNAGAGWTYDASWTVPVPIVHVKSGPSYVDAGTRLADVDGDGLIDILIYRPNSSEAVYLHDGVKPDLLSTVTNQYGGEVTVQYGSSPAGGENPFLPFVLDVVSTTTRDSGIGATEQKVYQYEDGLYYAQNTRDRKFAGFGMVTETDSSGFSTKKYFHQGSSTESSVGEYDDHISKIGKIFRTEVYDENDNLFAKSISKWDRHDRGDGASFVKLGQSVSFSYDGDSDHKDKAESFTYNDSFGNATQKLDWGEVTGSDDGTFSDAGTDKFTTTFTYATSTATSTVFALSQENTTDQNASKVRETKQYFDTLSFGSLNKGNPTKEERWATSTTYVDTERTYNGYGLVTQEKDPRDKATNYTYDALNLYPATTTNPLSQTTERYYDYSAGKAATTTDANGRVFATVFDPLDRPKEEKQPDLTSPSTLVTRAAYSYVDSGIPHRIFKTSSLNSATSSDAYTYLDGFNRKVQERVEAESTNTYSAKEYAYDGRGLLLYESFPFFSDGTSYTGTTSPAASALLTRYIYDPLKRAEAIGTSVGTTTNLYDDWTTTTIDPRGSAKKYTNDAFGNLTQVVENDSESLYTTAYQYNGNNKLTKLTDALGNVRNFTFDGLGRRLTAQDLHDTGDSVFGLWTYAYDAAGNMSSSTDPKGQLVEYTYDDLNRTLTENYAGTAGTEVTYVYDTCTEGVGRLCTATSTDAATNYAYNALGLTATETKTINNTYYATSYSYDRVGNTTLLTYPDNAQVSYTYNGAGQLEALAKKEPGGSFTSVIDDFDYAPIGKLTLKDFANGVQSSYTYDSDHLYRLTNITTATSTGGSGGMGDFDWTDLMLNGGSLALAEGESADVGPGSEDAESELPADIQMPEPEGEVAGTSTTSEISQELPTEEAVTETASSTEPIFEIATTSTSVADLLLDPSVIATTTELTASSTEPIAIDPLALKAPVERLLGYQEYEDGTVKYAYRTDTKVTNIAPGSAVYSAARERDFAVTGEVSSLRTTYARTFSTDRDGVYVTETVGGVPQYYEDEEGNWWQADYATTTIEAFDAQINPPQAPAAEDTDPVSLIGRFLRDIFSSIAKSVYAFFVSVVYADTLTFYPDPNTETASVDGQTSQEGTYTSWSAIHDDSASDASDDSDTNLPLRVRATATTNNWDRLFRVYTLFDTSSLPDNATISSATYSVYGQNLKIDSAGTAEVAVVTTSPASNTTIVTDDFDQSGTAQQASNMAVSSWTVGAYNDFTLNATGTASISKTGVTKFGLRFEKDRANNSTWSSGLDMYVEASAAETSGTSQDPKLVVTYTAASSSQGTLIQDISYTYDAVGNITQIDDVSDTGTGKIVSYAYDDLNRLTSASTTAASSTPYIENFSYNAIGNITNKTDDSLASGILNTYSLDLEAGSSQYASIEDASQVGLDFTDALTLSAWVKFESLPSSGNVMTLVSKRRGTENQRSYIFNLENNAGTKRLYFVAWSNGSSDTGILTVNWTPSTDTWYHVAVTKSGTSVKFYVNGAQQGGTQTASASAVYDGSAPFEIGNFAEDNSLFDGKIDDVRVWSRELSSTEMSSQYSSPSTASNGTNLKGWWRLNNSYIDNSGSGNTLWPSNSPSFSADVPYAGGASSQFEGYQYNETNYANPHAMTAIGNGLSTTTYAYDANGNLASTTAGWTYLWDYRNRLATSTTGTATTTYAYDHTEHRVKKSTATTTTLYPNDNWEKAGATTTRYIFAAGDLIATIEGNGNSTSTRFYHADHLGSTNAVTDEDGDVIQALDYYPYGANRVDSGTDVSGREFIGEQFDEETAMSYLNARFYSNDRGQFISQDSNFWALPAGLLFDPQQAHSYSYARNNPIANRDTDGKRVEAIAKAIEKDSRGTHIFLLISPDNPADFAEMGRNWTVGAYADSSGSTLTKGIDASYDRAVADRGYSGMTPDVGFLKQRAEVQRPEGMTDTEFINKIMAEYNAYQGDAAYDPLALKGYNSNNFVTGLLQSAGAKTLPWGGNARGVDPGYGQPIPKDYTKTTGQSVPNNYGTLISYSGQQGSQATEGFIKRALVAIRDSLSSLLKSLKSR